eukprot:23398_6
MRTSCFFIFSRLVTSSSALYVSLLVTAIWFLTSSLYSSTLRRDELSLSSSVWYFILVFCSSVIDSCFEVRASRDSRSFS